MQRSKIKRATKMFSVGSTLGFAFSKAAAKEQKALREHISFMWKHDIWDFITT